MHVIENKTTLSVVVGMLLGITSTSFWMSCPPSKSLESLAGPLLFPWTGSSDDPVCSCKELKLEHTLDQTQANHLLSKS
jgi:hypothetical protein